MFMDPDPDYTDRIRIIRIGSGLLADPDSGKSSIRIQKKPDPKHWINDLHVELTLIFLVVSCCRPLLERGEKAVVVGPLLLLLL